MFINKFGSSNVYLPWIDPFRSNKRTLSSGFNFVGSRSNTFRINIKHIGGVLSLSAVFNLYTPRMGDRHEFGFINRYEK